MTMPRAQGSRALFQLCCGLSTLGPYGPLRNGGLKKLPCMPHIYCLDWMAAWLAGLPGTLISFVTKSKNAAAGLLVPCYTLRIGAGWAAWRLIRATELASRVPQLQFGQQ